MSYKNFSDEGFDVLELEEDEFVSIYLSELDEDEEDEEEEEDWGDEEDDD